MVGGKLSGNLGSLNGLFQLNRAKAAVSELGADRSKRPGSKGRLGQKELKKQQINEVYVQYHEELRSGMMSKFTISRADAEDIVQTAFARYAETTSVIENSRAFLYKACSNIAIDQIRRRQVQTSYAKSVIDSEDGAGETLGPERLVAGRQRLGIISRAMWAMPGKRRKLLLMSRFDGLSYAEIARRVNLSETVVRKHITNALADCQKALQAQTK